MDGGKTRQSSTLMYGIVRFHYVAACAPPAPQLLPTFTQPESSSRIIRLFALHLLRKAALILFNTARAAPNQHCPTLGCRSKTANTRGRWRPRPLNYSLVIDEQRAALHDCICNDCWNRHTGHTRSLDGRTRVSPIDQLAAAAAAEGSSSLPTSSPPPLPPPSPPLPLPPPPPPPSPLASTSLHGRPLANDFY